MSLCVILYVIVYIVMHMYIHVYMYTCMFVLTDYMYIQCVFVNIVYVCCVIM